MKWVVLFWVVVAVLGLMFVEARGYEYTIVGVEADSTYTVRWVDPHQGDTDTLDVVATSDSLLIFNIPGINPQWDLLASGPDVTPPSTPTFATGSWAFGPDTMSVVWNSVSDPSTPVTYRVRETVAILDSTGRTASTDTTWVTSPNVQYTFQVSALDAVDNRSEWSAGTARYSAADTCPVASEVSVTSTSITVNPHRGTNPSSTEMAIQVERDGTEVYNWVSAGGSLSGSETWQDDATWGSIEITGLPSDVTYNIRVKPRNGDNLEQVLNDTLQSTTAAGGNNPPTAVVTYDVRPYPTDVTKMFVWWRATTDPDGDTVEYRLYYREGNSDSGWVATENTWQTDTTYTFSGAHRDSTFYFKVQARDDKADTSNSARSAWTAYDNDKPLPYPITGYGATLGGLHYPTVEVTTTNESGVGSFKEALAAGDRYIRFDASLSGGTITWTSGVRIPSSSGNTDTTLCGNITIDGDDLASPVTIDGSDGGFDGIIIDRGGTEAGSANDIIVSNVRWYNFGETSGANEANGLNIGGESWPASSEADSVLSAFRIAVNHCSFDDCTDGGVDVVDYARAVTVQYNLIANSPLKGTLVDGSTRRLTYYRNILTDVNTRYPSIKETGATIGGASPSPYDAYGVMDVRNNIAHDWGAYGAQWIGTTDPGDVASVGNAISNVFVPGNTARPERAFVLQDGNQCWWEGNWFYGDAGPIGHNGTAYYADPAPNTVAEWDLHLGYTMATWDSADVRDSLQFSCGALPNNATDAAYIATVMADIPVDETAPAVPTFAPDDFSLTSTSVTAAWNRVTDPSTPVTYLLQDSVFTTDYAWTSDSTTVATTTANSLRYFRVRSKDGSGNASAFSVAMDTVSAIETPSALTFTIDSTNIVVEITSTFSVGAYPGATGAVFRDSAGTLNSMAEWDTLRQSTTATASPLTPNTYYGQIRARGVNQDSVFTAWYDTTVIATNVGKPGAPTAVAVSSTSLDVTPKLNANPAGSDIAIIVTKKLVTEEFRWVDTDGSRTNGPVYQSVATWGTIEVTGLEVAQAYRCFTYIRGKNGDTMESEYTLVATQSRYSGDTYYVDASSGHDTTGTGAPSAPWRTFSKAFSSGSLSDGDRVYAVDGTWSGVLAPCLDTLTANVEIYAENSGSAIFSGESCVDDFAFVIDEARSKVAFNGLTWSNYGGTNIVKSAISVAYASGLAESLLVQNCTVSSSDSTTGLLEVRLSSTADLDTIIVTGNNVSETFAHAVYIANSGAPTFSEVTIQNNTIVRDINPPRAALYAIYIDNCASPNVSNNTLRGYGWGIYAQPSTLATIYRNEIGLMGDEGIRINTGTATYNTIRNCYAYAIMTVGAATVEHNTLFSNAYRFSGQALAHVYINANDATIKNNIMYDIYSEANTWRFVINDFGVTGTTCDYNLYYNDGSDEGVDNLFISGFTNYTWDGWQGLGFDANGEWAEPAMVDTTGYRFYLRSNSPGVLDADDGLNMGAWPTQLAPGGRRNNLRMRGK